MIKYIKDHPQFIIKDLLKNLFTVFGIGITRQTIYNILKRNNITRKRIQMNKYPHSKERFNEKRKRLQKQIKCRKHRIMSIDEIGIQINAKNNWMVKKWKRMHNKYSTKNKDVRYSLLFAKTKRESLSTI